MESFTFGIADYIMFVLMLIVSAAVGIYYGFFAKSSDTTVEYLMGGRKMKIVPIAISLISSQLQAFALITVPAEFYSYGLNYMIYILAMLLAVPLLCCVVVPVFYENKISNCYEYLQLRFNKQTRQIVTASFVIYALLMMPIVIYLPSMAFSQVSGINPHLINGVISGICMFYTMLGGVKAVVWTDVIQGGIILISVILVAVLGTRKVGGLQKVLQIADSDGHLNLEYSLDSHLRANVWNVGFSGFLLWIGHIGLQQTCAQRIVSLPTYKHARKSVFIACFGLLFMFLLCFYNGCVMFAHYYGCDPIKLGLVEKPDKLMSFFIQDVMGHLNGMSGLFISCIFSAALSAMSAKLNALAGVIYFDGIKPFIRHTEARANATMKALTIVIGIYCVLAGLMVEKFSSILQSMITISSVITGPTIGLFLLGMFVPRVSGKAAVISFIASVGALTFLTIKAQMLTANGTIHYPVLPTSIDGCTKPEFMEIVSLISSRTSNVEAAPTLADANNERSFSIFEISFYWYKPIAIVLVWSLGNILSYIWPQPSEHKLEAKLFAPVIRSYVKYDFVEMEQRAALNSKPQKFINSDSVHLPQEHTEVVID